ncbi:Hypothetical_protein [Hexamita inflata]|uniref:Hypothetical_protein n=1 Tax=Hexamita inflata TaxID=28002 RepID=A0AA86PVB7_9EUKA|nr:Hypothetical protein HINF_LOCUS33146 [Hexamita inflata]
MLMTHIDVALGSSSCCSAPPKTGQRYRWDGASRWLSIISFENTKSCGRLSGCGQRHARKEFWQLLMGCFRSLGDPGLEAGPEELLPVSGEVLVYLVAELFVVRKDGASVGAAEDLEEPLCVQLLELLVLLLDIAVIHLSNFLPGTLLTIGFWEAAKLLVHELLHGYFHELLLEGVHIHVQLQGQLGEPGVVLGVRQHHNLVGHQLRADVQKAPQLAQKQISIGVHLKWKQNMFSATVIENMLYEMCIARVSDQVKKL